MQPTGGSGKPQARSLIGLALLVLAALSAQSWWTGHLRAEVGAEVAALARPGDIHMLSSDSCGICDQARRWFVANHVPFTECSIERDGACRAAFDARLAPGTPVLLVRERVLLGFSPEQLRAALTAGR
jgi:hypothetical protein